MNETRQFLRCNRCRWSLAAWLLIVSCTLANATPPVETIELAPGSSLTLEFPAEIGTAFVANPQTADVEVLNKETLFVLGHTVGVTSLSVFDTVGDLLAAFRVRVSAQSEQARTVVSRIAGEDAPIRVDPVGNSLFVSGTAKSPSEAERVLRGIRAVSGETPVVDAIGIDGPAQVNLEVLISEVSRNVSQTLGIDWSVDLNPFESPLRTWITGTGTRIGTGALSIANELDQDVLFYPVGPDGQVGDAPRFVNEVSELTVVNNERGGDGGVVLSHSELFQSDRYRATVFLEALAENGLAVVHARPNLTTVSGQPAEFFSGLEIPVPTITDRGTIGTEYRQTGVSLSFTPTVLDSDQISLTVQPRIREVAAGGATIAGTVVPNINERSASTTVELGDGESIAIAGLYRRSTTSTEAGIPLLRDIPVWGALFRNTSERDRSVELIIVVTPRIVSATQALASTASVARGPTETARQLANEFYY